MANSDNHSTGGNTLQLLGILTFIAGAFGYVGARIGAWWQHG